MTGNELYKLLQDGNKILCKISEGMFEDFNFGDEGMLVEVSFQNQTENDVYKVTLDGTKYIDHNHEIALPNWYDSNNQPTLKYFELNNPITEIETLYIFFDDKKIGLNLVEENSLIDEYLKSKSEKTFVTWLENLVIEMRE